MLGIAALVSSIAPQANAQELGPFRTQTIELEAGWNAVYLSIEPTQSDPDVLFEGTPIEIAATYFRPSTSMQFIDKPNDVLADRSAWSVWYAPERDDAVLSDLYSIQAHRSYLVYTEADYTWELYGTPFFDRTLWQPNGFSLVGFNIDLGEQPTVANFFSGADAHQPLNIYQMQGGKWLLLNQPESTLMQPGVAYWTESDGASDFSGPLHVDFDSSASGGIVFTPDSSFQDVVLKNTSLFPQELSLTLEAGETGEIPVAYVIRALNTGDAPIENLTVQFPDSLSIGPLEPGASFALTLKVDQSAVTEPLMATTLRIASDAGQLVDVPLLSIRRDLLND